MSESMRRGVSELIGYILIFGIVISLVTLTMNFAPGLISDIESREAGQTTVQNLQQIDDEVEEIRYGANQRFLRLELPPGQFQQLEPTEINITDGTTWSNHTTTPIHFTSDKSKPIIYEPMFIAYKPNGQYTNAQMWDGSRETLQRSNISLPIMNIQPFDGRFGFSSTTTSTKTFLINKTTIPQPTKVHTFNSAPTTIRVSVTTNVPTAWEAYLEHHRGLSINPTLSDDYDPNERATIVAETTLDSDEQFSVVSQSLYIIPLN